MKSIKCKSRGDEDTEKKFAFGPRQCIPSDYLTIIYNFFVLLYKTYQDHVSGASYPRKKVISFCIR